MNPKKFLIFDAGPIISLTMNGLLPTLEKLKQIFKGEFIVTAAVKKEIIDKPLRSKKYALEAFQVQTLFEKGILKPASEFVPQNKIIKTTREMMNSVNRIFKDERTGERIQLLHEGEASCLAFSKLCQCENVIVIDERTTRMLIEAPNKIQELMEKKLHTRLKFQNKEFKDLGNFKFIRSAELLFVAYKKDLLWTKKSKEILDALLYGVKLKGTAISSREIEAMKKLA